MEKIRTQFRNASIGLWCNVWYWRVAVCRVLLYSFLGMSAAFLAASETWGDDTWDNMRAFTRFRLFILVLAAAIPPIIAFFDSTITLLKGERGSGHTGMWKKDE